MKKYYPKKLIGKKATGVFSDIRILVAIGGTTILALLLPIFLYAPLMQVYNRQHAYTPVNSDLYGFSPGSNILGLSSTDLTRTLNDYNALGARWARFDFAWP